MAEWEQIFDGEPPLQLESSAVDQTDVADTFVEMVRYMVSRTDEDGSAEREALFVLVNATNGYCRSCWMKNDENATGEWAYTLQFKALWDASIEHDSGSTFLDDTCRDALLAAAERAKSDGILAPEIGIWLRTEIGSLERY